MDTETGEAHEVHDDETSDPDQLEAEPAKLPPTIRLGRLLHRTKSRKSEMLRRLKATAYRHGLSGPEGNPA